MPLSKPPRTQLPGSFFGKFRDPDAAIAAQELEHWARENGLVFQAGSKVETRETYYVRVPNGKPSCTLLTLQPDEAFLDVPFRRMKGGAFASRSVRLEFLERLRQAIPTRDWDDSVVDDAKHGFAPIEWRYLTDPAVRGRFTEVLEWAVSQIRALS
jgi:hypothetical protein